MLLAALTVPLLVLGALVWLAWRDTWTAAERELARGADAAAEYALRVLDTHRLAGEVTNFLLIGLSDDQIREQEGNLHRQVQGLLQSLPGVVTLFVVDRDAEGLVTGGVYPLPRGLRVPDREWIVGLQTPGGPDLHISAVTTGRLGGSSVFFAVSRRRTGTGNGLPAGSFDGVISVGVDPHRLSAGLETLSGEPGDVASLVRADGALLARSSGFPLPPPGIPAGSPLRDAARAGVVRGGYIGRPLGLPTSAPGEARLIAFRQVGELPLYATMARPTSMVVARWRETMLLQLGVGLPAWALLVALAFLLQRRQRELAAVNASLERRIEARTAELQDSEARARSALMQLDTIYATAPVGRCLFDRDGRYRRANAELAEMTGVPVEHHIGRSIREVTPDIADALEALHRHVIETGQPALKVEIEGETLAYPGVQRSWVADWSPLHGEQDEVVGVNVVVRDVTEERAVARALADSEARFRALVRATSDVIYRMSPDWSEMRRLDGRGFLVDASAPTEAWLDTYIPDEEKPRVLKAIAAAIHQRGVFELEHQVFRADGSIGWTLSRAIPLLDERGKVQEWFGAASDVTERRRAEERRALLTREVDHRARNVLAVVQAALRLTPKDDPVAYARAVEGRVAALGRAHTILAAGKWKSGPLRALVEAELAAFQPAEKVPAPAEQRVAVEGPDLALAPEAVQALSMAIHELATNAAKYGALSAPEGRVSVSWKLDRALGQLVLTWRERGGPRVADTPARRGFGSRVIEATVKNQLGGTVERAWDEQGLVCIMTVPVARVLAAGGAAAA